MVPLLRIRSSRRPGRTPTDQGRVVASSPAGRLACASLRQGLSEPRSGRWRTSSTSGPAPTTTCCCRRRRLRPAAAREGPTLVVACGWDTISYSSSIRHLASDNVFVIQRVTRPGGGINDWLHFLPISMHKLIDQVLRQLFPNTRFAIVATRVEVAEEKWRRHRRKKWRNFLVITTLLLFMVGYVLYFI